jgi:hypothetical protein
MEDLVRSDFADVSEPEKASEDRLSNLYSKLPLYEMWCTSIAAEVNRIMLSGKSLPNLKVVTGKQGNRAWSDVKAVEAKLKSLPDVTDAEIFDTKLKSPTAIADSDLVTRFPDEWHEIHKLITRSPGKLVVTHESDKRVAVVIGNAADSFVNVSSDVSDLI